MPQKTLQNDDQVMVKMLSICDVLMMQAKTRLSAIARELPNTLVHTDLNNRGYGVIRKHVTGLRWSACRYYHYGPSG